MADDTHRWPRVFEALRRHWLLAGVLALTLSVHLWGIQRDLPYISEDPAFVKAAVRVASSGNLNPRWFGHPGSTLIYPLAAVYRGWHALAHGGSVLRNEPHLAAAYTSSPAQFHLLGRLLTVVYALLSVLVVYRIGREAFGEDVAPIAALFAALYPTEVFDKMVRTDSASVLFGLLGLWRCVRLYDRPTLANQLLAGAAVGLAIGTKYYLGMLVVLLVIVDGLVVWRHAGRRRALLLGAGAGLIAVAVAFALSTPYFFFDHTTAAKDLQVERRSSQIGADGFSAMQNVFWYLATALPAAMSWPQAIAASAGLGLSLRARASQPLLLAMVAVIFIAGISFSSLHWARWLVPVLPVCALFAAYGLEAVVAGVSRGLRLSQRRQRSLLAVAALLFAAPSANRVIQMDRLHARPSTNVLARQWIEDNLPTGSTLAFEWQTLPPPLQADPLELGRWVNRDGGCHFTELSMSQLSRKGSISNYRRDGYRYLITSSVYYDYFLANADQHPAEAAFYRTLFSEGRLLYRVAPSASQQGDEIRVYELP